MRQLLILLLLGACADAQETSSTAPVSGPAGAPQPVVPSASSSPPTNSSTGIDVSHIQGAVDWSAVVATGQSFVFIKATQGITVVDPQFAANWQGAGAVGLKRGPYHFYQPGDDPQAQAEHFLASITLGESDLPAVLDIETAVESGGSSEAGAQLVQDISTWLKKVESATGKKPVIYTSPGFWNNLGDHDFGAYPLWVAEYGVDAPKPVAGWSTWTLWQFSESGAIAGIGTAVDLSKLNASSSLVGLSEQ
jgi:lysozyme